MIISAKHSILDVWQGSDYVSRLLKLFCCVSKRGYTGKLIYAKHIYLLQTKNFPLFWVHTFNYKIQAKEKAINHLIWCFCALFYFLHSTVPDKCDKEKLYVLFVTCIKIVMGVLACAHVIAHIKWRRLTLSDKGKEML